MKVCIVGTGDGGSTAAIQIRRLNGEAQIDMFSKRTSLGCPPCEMPLVIGGTVATWDELVRGFRQDSFWEKRNVAVHLNTKVTDIDREGKRIIADGKEYSYDKLILALGAIPVIPSVPGLDGKSEFALSTDMADGIALGNAVASYTEAAVVGVPHAIKGSSIYSFVTLKTGVQGTDELKKELIAHVRKQIGPIATPDKIQFADALPKTRSGKIMRRVLKAVAEKASIGDLSTLEDEAAVEEVIKSYQELEKAHAGVTEPE